MVDRERTGEGDMKSTVERTAVDLGEYPDLVVIYLGMKVRKLRGVLALLRNGPQIDKAGAERPDGLLHFENNIIFSLFPLHVGMRWYWRDFESLERWAREETHRLWWQSFLRDSGGTGFWHEAYFMRGGMEAVYVDMQDSTDGFLGFAPKVAARGAMFSARGRVRAPGEVLPPPPGTGPVQLDTKPRPRAGASASQYTDSRTGH
jgi:hypothetical protein